MFVTAKPGKLNETGVLQAEDVRDRLRNERIDAFVSSDLHRSVQTCKIIAAPHHQEVVQTPLLRERDWGSFTGKYIPDLQAVKQWPSDIEPLDALKERARRFLEWVKMHYPDERDRTDEKCRGTHLGAIIKTVDNFIAKAVHLITKNNPLKNSYILSLNRFVCCLSC